MKKIVTALFLTFLLLTSCVSKNERNIEKDNTNISIQDVPFADEIKEWEASEIYNLKAQIEQIPLDSCEEYFTNEAKVFLNRYENVELDNIVIGQDNLSIINGQNRKSLYNLDFEVNIVIDTSDDVGSNKFAKDLSEQLVDFFERYSYFGLKAKKLDINVFDLNHTKFHDISCDFSVMNETVFVEQPEDEYAVQTLAFNFSDTNPNFTLQKFGVIPESNELYVEYFISDDYFDYDNLKHSIADLDKIGIEIKEYLISQKTTKEFVLSKGVNLLTVSFYSGNLEDTYLTFNFELFNRIFPVCDQKRGK